MTNTAPVGAFRGAGRPEAAAALDRVHRPRRPGARHPARGDPAANLIPKDAVPLPDADRRRPTTSATTSSRSRRRCGSPTSTRARAEQQRRIDAGETKLLGIGLATYVEITGFGGSEFGSVQIHADGSATVMSGTSAHGQGHATSFSMIVADRLGIPLEKITLPPVRHRGRPHGRRHRRLAVAAARRQRRQQGRRRDRATRPSRSPPGCSRPIAADIVARGRRLHRRRRAGRRRSRGSSWRRTPTSTTADSASTPTTRRTARRSRSAPTSRSSRSTSRPARCTPLRHVARRRLRPHPQPADRGRPAARRRRSRASARRSGRRWSTTRTARRSPAPSPTTPSRPRPTGSCSRPPTPRPRPR